MLAEETKGKKQKAEAGSWGPENSSPGAKPEPPQPARQCQTHRGPEGAIEPAPTPRDPSGEAEDGEVTPGLSGLPTLRKTTRGVQI